MSTNHHLEVSSLTQLGRQVHKPSVRLKIAAQIEVRRESNAAAPPFTGYVLHQKTCCSNHMVRLCTWRVRVSGSMEHRSAYLTPHIYPNPDYKCSRLPWPSTSRPSGRNVTREVRGSNAAFESPHIHRGAANRNHLTALRECSNHTT